MKHFVLWKRTPILAMLALALATGLLAGCTGKEGGSGNLSAFEVGKRIELSADLGNMKQGDAERLNKLYHLSSGDVADFVLYTASSNVKADELLIIQLKEGSEKEPVLAKIEERIAAQTVKFKDYRPEEYHLIEKCVLKTHGLFILFAVSPEAGAMERIFDETFS
ncbi:DUF4358 domain-containing protein [uncultured Paenibacillus sp.]|uniref:DUF4358 domain-containing protein n=1 Tax=uncultured Paenibacillus sp. TaxID=227322 RepID=UPI0015B29624|nr:DUF4358 domain-containing protein [uncultured Paenibacillus sp.]